ncbi:hypothetical protein P7K49_024519 [Saguinus oedipus]|uniref:Uncharacterized protein n=1 Tax=Saguinus oedipus TaxID=9490 RepID=A0ABQ9URD9_SAGOE|nr:hypothetical protein P7K49_024519 [Saguinus oedipus]
MEESMEEEEGGSYEAMMDDQNHNNWEAALDGFRQPPPPPSSIPAPVREPPGGQLLAVPAVSVDRKGPKEGLPMGPPPPPEANGVIMMLKSCDAAAAVAKAAPAPTASSTININTSTSKFCESSLSQQPWLFSTPLGRRIHPLLKQAPLPLFQASVFPPLPVPLPPPLRPLPLIWCLRPAPERPWLLVLPGLERQPGTHAAPSFTNAILITTGCLNIAKLFSHPSSLEVSPSK